MEKKKQNINEETPSTTQTKDRHLLGSLPWLTAMQHDWQSWLGTGTKPEPLCPQQEVSAWASACGPGPRHQAEPPASTPWPCGRETQHAAQHSICREGMSFPPGVDSNTLKAVPQPPASFLGSKRLALSWQPQENTFATTYCTGGCLRQALCPSTDRHLPLQEPSAPARSSLSLCTPACVWLLPGHYSLPQPSSNSCGILLKALPLPYHVTTTFLLPPVSCQATPHHMTHTALVQSP